MQMRVSSNGKSLVLLEPLELVGFGPGDVVDVTVRAVRHEPSRSAKGFSRGKIIIDPRTGLPLADTRAASAIAADGIVSEVASKTLLLSGSATRRGANFAQNAREWIYLEASGDGNLVETRSAAL